MPPQSGPTLTFPFWHPSPDRCKIQVNVGVSAAYELQKTHLQSLEGGEQWTEAAFPAGWMEGWMVDLLDFNGWVQDCHTGNLG